MSRCDYDASHAPGPGRTSCLLAVLGALLLAAPHRALANAAIVRFQQVDDEGALTHVLPR